MKASILVPAAALAAAAVSLSGCPVGITAGAGWTDFQGDGVISDSRRTGERGGALLVLGPQKVAFMGEVVYVRRGAESAQLVGMTKGEKIDLQYMQVNYMLKLGFGRFVSLFTGPYTAFITDADSSGPIPGVGSGKITDSVDDVEAGWVVGVGLKMGFFIVDFRWEFGLTSVFDSPGSPNIENSALALSGTLKF
jgi:hypothetical protein